jgi:hypothetical protein
MTERVPPRRLTDSNIFHNPTVTSDLVPKFKSRDHSRGRDSLLNSKSSRPKSFVV